MYDNLKLDTVTTYVHIIVCYKVRFGLYSHHRLLHFALPKFWFCFSIQFLLRMLKSILGLPKHSTNSHLNGDHDELIVVMKN